MSFSRLVIKDLVKTFDDGTHALGPLSLDIEHGSFTAILGPSGCGKSTLLRLIAGLLAHQSGTISFGADARPRFGFVFQEPTLMPWRTVAGNVALPLELSGRTDQAAVMSALERVGLAAFADHHPRRLSGGMKMRVSVARAAAGDPDLLLMDEPFAALDEISRGALNDDLLQLHADRKLTVLFVTHSVFESVYLASRIVVLSKRPGRIVADIAVDAPPARGEDWRLSSDYAALARRVSAALREGSA